MRVLAVYAGSYPWDVRVEKMLTWLAGRGHQVHLLCANHERRPCREELDGATIHRLPRLPRWLGPAQLAVGLPSPVNPVWFFAIKGLLASQPCDVVLVRDLQVALAAVAAARAAGLPLVLDLAENWPSLLAEWRRQEGWSLQNLLFRHPRASRVVERMAVARADHILVVVEEMRERLVRELGADPERVAVVMNTPKQGLGRRAPRADARLLLVYCGTLHLDHGLDVALQGVARARAAGLPVGLRLIGRGKPKQEAGLRALAHRLGVESAVEFTGWRPQGEALALAGEGDVGLCPLGRYEENETTISNKLFEYMSLGLPVLCSDVRPQRRIVEETGAGLVFAAGSPEAMADAIPQFLDPGRRAAWGAAGRRAVETCYHWDRDGAALERVLEGVAARRRVGVVSDG